MSNHKAELDFSSIERFPGFRADYLYFLRLVNNYIGEIFCQTFPKGTNNKNANKRNKKLREIIDKIEENNFTKYNHLINFVRKRTGSLDCFSEGFCKLLEEIKQSKSLLECLNNKLMEEHAIFYQFEEQKKLLNTTTKDGKRTIKQKGHQAGNFNEETHENLQKKAIDDLITDLDKLRKKRNYLEHYERDKNKNTQQKYPEEEIIKTLGQFLLPELLFMFVGRLRHYAKRQSECDMTDIIEQVEGLFRIENKNRSERTKEMFDFVRSKKNKKNRDNKSKRKTLVDENLPWRVEFRKSCQQKGDYKENKFRIRYAFIGQNNIDNIEQLLQPLIAKNTQPNSSLSADNSDGYKVGLSFKREIEPIYYLSQKINLVLHRTISECFDEQYEQELKKRFLRRYVGGSKAQKKQKSKIRECEREGKASRAMRLIRQIRDPLAHNGMFWNIRIENKKISISDVFTIAKKIIAAARFLEDDKNLNRKRNELKNNMKVQILTLLEKNNYALMSQRNEPGIRKIKKWNKDIANKYQDKELYNFDMRRSSTRLAGKWKKTIRKSLKN